MELRKGTYIREPDGACLIYHSPYSFNDAAENFRKRDLYDDGWKRVHNRIELELLWNLVKLCPGEYVFISGGVVV